MYFLKKKKGVLLVVQEAHQLSSNNIEVKCPFCGEWLKSGTTQPCGCGAVPAKIAAGKFRFYRTTV